MVETLEREAHEVARDATGAIGQKERVTGVFLRGWQGTNNGKEEKAAPVTSKCFPALLLLFFFPSTETASARLPGVGTQDLQIT